LPHRLGGKDHRRIAALSGVAEREEFEMIAYHGSVMQGISVLKPFANPISNLDYAAVYLTTYKPLASIYIWDKPYKWMNYGFSEEGVPIYTESKILIYISSAVKLPKKHLIPISGRNFSATATQQGATSGCGSIAKKWEQQICLTLRS